MKVSIYKNAHSKMSNESAPFKQVISWIKEGKWQDPVLGYRTGKVKKEYSPAFTPSGLFMKERKAAQLTKHSGIIVIDFDAKDNADINLLDYRDELYSDKYTHAGFVSISGKGLSLFVKINPSKHAESFEALKKYYANTYKLIIDSSGRDTSRLRFVSYDPSAFFNEHSEKWTTYIEKQKVQPQHYRPIFAEDDVDYVISQIQQSGIDITTDYEEWIKIGFALASEYGESGREKFHIISSNYHSYDHEKTDKKYSNLLKNSNNKTTIASFFWIAKQAGIKIRTPKTDKIVRVATVRKRQVGKSGGSKTDEDAKDETIKYLKEVENIEDAEKIVNDVFSLTEKELKSNESQISDIEILTEFIQTLDIRFNEVTDRIEYKGNDITDRDANSLYLNSKIVYPDLKFSKDTFFSIVESDRIQKYHPFRDFFKKYEHRKPAGNVETLLNSLIMAESEYKNIIGIYIYRWLLGLIECAIGDYSETTLVLIGEQGTYKTTFFRNLLPDELQPYYAESKLDNGKDDEILMTKKLLVVDDEFGGKSKKEATKYKDISSKKKFTNRKPYGRFDETRKRYAALGGTSNEREILNDTTGNRRIIPVHIDSIDIDKFNSIDKIDLFVELYHAWKAGEKWYLSKSEVETLNKNTEQFFEASMEEELLLKHFEPSKKHEYGAEFMTTTEMVNFCEGYLEKQRLYIKRFGQVLRKYKYERVKHKGIQGFWVRKISGFTDPIK